jgi:hypothetical protein
MARSRRSGAARGGSTHREPARTCPPACPARTGGSPALPWTRPGTPRLSWTKSGASTPGTTCGPPRSVSGRCRRLPRLRPALRDGHRRRPRGAPDRRTAGGHRVPAADRRARDHRQPHHQRHAHPAAPPAGARAAAPRARSGHSHGRGAAALRAAGALPPVAGPHDDIEIAGTIIPKGSQVTLVLASGSRDPAHVHDPDRFDPDRFAPTGLASPATPTSTSASAPAGSLFPRSDVPGLGFSGVVRSYSVDPRLPEDLAAVDALSHCSTPIEAILSAKSRTRWSLAKAPSCGWSPLSLRVTYPDPVSPASRSAVSACDRNWSRSRCWSPVAARSTWTLPLRLGERCPASAASRDLAARLGFPSTV